MKFISSKLHVRRCPLIYISKSNRYLRQSGCSFSFSVPCVREIEKVELKIVKTKPKYKNVTRFSKLLRSAPQSSLKLRFAIKLQTPLFGKGEWLDKFYAEFYSIAIKQNNELIPMKKAISAILWHCADFEEDKKNKEESEKEELCHKFCPRDSFTWCKY